MPGPAVMWKRRLKAIILHYNNISRIIIDLQALAKYYEVDILLRAHRSEFEGLCSSVSWSSWQCPLDGQLLLLLTASVNNGSGPLCLVRVTVHTEPGPNWSSGLSINTNRQLRYGSMVYSQLVWIGRVVSGSPSGSIHRFIWGTRFWSLLIVSYQNRVFNNQ